MTLGAFAVPCSVWWGWGRTLSCLIIWCISFCKTCWADLSTLHNIVAKIQEKLVSLLRQIIWPTFIHLHHLCFILKFCGLVYNKKIHLKQIIQLMFPHLTFKQVLNHFNLNDDQIAECKQAGCLLNPNPSPDWDPPQIISAPLLLESVQGCIRLGWGPVSQSHRLICIPMLEGNNLSHPFLWRLIMLELQRCEQCVWRHTQCPYFWVIGRCLWLDFICSGKSQFHVKSKVLVSPVLL